jgi:hypothetical protein
MEQNLQAFPLICFGLYHKNHLFFAVIRNNNQFTNCGLLLYFQENTAVTSPATSTHVFF